MELKWGEGYFPARKAVRLPERSPERGEKRREEKGKRVHAYKRCVYIEAEKVLEDREVSGTDRHNPSLVLVIKFTGLAGWILIESCWNLIM